MSEFPISSQWFYISRITLINTLITSMYPLYIINCHQRIKVRNKYSILNKI